VHAVVGTRGDHDGDGALGFDAQGIAVARDGAAVRDHAHVRSVFESVRFQRARNRQTLRADFVPGAAIVGRRETDP
jgi:hypothetical protein